MAKCKTCGKSSVFLKVSEHGVCQECEGILQQLLEAKLSAATKLEGLLNRIDEESLPLLDTLDLYDEAILATVEMLDSELAETVPNTIDKLIKFRRMYFVEELPKLFGSTSRYNGEIGYHELEDWFDETFSDEERTAMIERYQPLGAKTNSLIEGKGTKQDTPTFLRGLLGWFDSPVENNIWQRIREKLNEYLFAFWLDQDNLQYDPSLYSQEIEYLIRHDKLEEAEELTLKCIRKVELDRENAMKFPPFYHKKMSIIYKKMGRINEAELMQIESDQIAVSNFIVQVRHINKYPEELRLKYHPNGVAMTKTLLASAKRLYKKNPSLLILDGLTQEYREKILVEIAMD